MREIKALESVVGLYDYEMCKLCPFETLLINSYFILKLYLNFLLKQFFKILESQNDVETILQNQPPWLKMSPL